MNVIEKQTDDGVELRWADSYVLRGRTFSCGAVGRGRDREEALNDLANSSGPRQMKLIFSQMLKSELGEDPKDSLPETGSDPVEAKAAPEVEAEAAPEDPQEAEVLSPQSAPVSRRRRGRPRRSLVVEEANPPVPSMSTESLTPDGTQPESESSVPDGEEERLNF